MGICLDTEQAESSETFGEGQDSWVQNSPNRDNRNITTPPNGKFAMHNAANVNFESPKVPVIFVLGGPGSGKVTHCDSLMQEKRGVVHINMTDLLQQYAVGNDGQTSLINIGNKHQDMQDFGLLSSKTVTEVLMLEMKMSPNAKTYLVSGYPRNMRDVVEYSDKIRTVNGVILISWRQKVLERQIDYGAKLGQVVLSLARMELNNFYKNVMPVADYFDQSSMLISINGERHPQDVYKDFRSSVFRILGQQDNPPVFANGKIAAVPADVTTELPTMPVAPGTSGPTPQQSSLQDNRPKTQVISVSQEQPTYQSPVKNGWPSVLWIIGGPGSNKATLADKAAQEVGWIHISLGRLLRSIASPPDTRYNAETTKIRDCISAGELIPLNIIMKIIESHMAANINAEGIILDGFPRDMNQVTEFEAKFKQKPTIILLDCSKLQLGRGRLDDSVTAFRRRLEIFRQSSLPMLKAMDNVGRLSIVDGDTDTAPVQQDFINVVKDHVQYINSLENVETTPPPSAAANTNHIGNGHIPNGHVPISDTTVYDLEDEPIETISKNVSNGIRQVANGFANGHLKAPPLANGYAGHSKTTKTINNNNNIIKDDARQMYNEINHMDGHI